MNEEVRAILLEFEVYLEDQLDRLKDNIVNYQDLDNDQINRLRGGAWSINKMIREVATRRKKLELDFMEDDDD